VFLVFTLAIVCPLSEVIAEEEVAPENREITNFVEQQNQGAYVSESEVDTNANEEGTEAEDINIENEMLNEEGILINAHEHEFNNNDGNIIEDDDDNLSQDDGDRNSLGEEAGRACDEEIQVDDNADDNSSTGELSSMEGNDIVQNDEQPRVSRSVRSNAGKGVPKLRVSCGGRTYSSGEELRK